MNNNTSQIFIWLSLGLIVFILITCFLTIIMFYKKVPQGKAFIRKSAKETRIATDRGIFVVPFLHKLEIVDIDDLKKTIKIN